MSGASLTSKTVGGVTLLSDWRRPSGVTFAFTERSGGVSEGGYATLNLGCEQGDDPRAVEENRRRALTAIGAAHLATRLVNPHQVHGTDVAVIRSDDDESLLEAQTAVREGVDAVVCTTTDVPVLLCYADCVPVVLTAPGAFAVAHSGWRGTMGRIASRTLSVLCDEASCAPSEVQAYIGPHIGTDDYTVSEELALQFAEAFGPDVVAPGNKLDLGACVVRALCEGGVPEGSIACVAESTAQATERFYSYRASGGACGRHGALAVMLGDRRGEV